MTTPRVDIDIQLNKRQALADLRAITNAASDADSAFDDLVASANRASSALADIGSRSIDISVNDSEIENALSLINDLEQGVSIDVTVDESEIETALGLIADLEEDASVRVGVQEDELDEALRNIEDIRNMQAIELTLNIAGTAVDLLTGGLETALDISGVGGLFEMQTLLAQMEAQVGTLIPEADRLINEIWTDGWGDSREQISSVLTQAQQLGVEMESLEVATRNALILSDITGEDPAGILRTMTTLVRTEMVPDFETAGDVIASMFQAGADSSGDLLDTLNEYGTTFQALDMSAEDIQAFLTAGLEAGIWNTDLIADSFREFNIRANEVTDGVGLLDEQFADLSIDELAEQFRLGEVAGDDFIKATIGALSEVEDPLEQSRLAVELFGTQFEDIDPQVFIDALNEADSAAIEFEGTLDDAGTALSETLPSAWERMQRVVSTGLGEALDEQFNITTLLDDLTGDITTFFDSLDSGTGIEGSFRIAFDDNEVVEVLLEVREAITDGFFSLGIGIADTLDALPLATGDNVREAISGLAGGELQIDLATAESADQIEDAVADALSRGVDSSDLLTSLSDQFDIAVEIGDVEQVVALRDAMEGIANTATGEDLMSQFGVTQDALDELSIAIDGVGMNASFNETFETFEFNRFFDEFNIPEDAQADIRAQLETVLGNPELMEGLLNPEGLIDLESISETADAMIETLTTQMNDALDNEDFATALNIGSALEEATGDTSIVDGIEMLADDMGVSLDDLETAADDASMGVTTSMETMDEATTLATDNQIQAIQDASDAYTALRQNSTIELDATQSRYGTFSQSIVAETDTITTAISSINAGLVGLSMNMASIPSNFGSTVTSNMTVNTTNNIASPAQQGNANAQVAETIATGGIP